MNKGQVYGYVRVSTREQRVDRQVAALQDFGVPDAGMVVEKLSGKDFNRPAYQALVQKLRPGDTLVVKSIDRLGRNYKEIIAQWRFITQEKGAAIVVTDMPMLDTREKDRDLTGAFVADLVLQIMSYMAEMERAFNRQRQAEGITAAKARGTRFGRRPKARPALFAPLRDLWRRGQLSARDAAQRLGVSHPTFIAWASEE